MALTKTGACTLRSFVVIVRVVFVFHIVHTHISYSIRQYIFFITGGTGKFWYKLNDTTDGTFYFFLDEQWPLAAVDDKGVSFPYLLYQWDQQQSKKASKISRSHIDFTGSH